MTCNERIMHALAGLREAGKAAVSAERVEAVHASGQDFVNVGLVSHIKDQSVAAGVKGFLDGERGLHKPQIGGEMPACLRNVVDQKLPQLAAELLVPLLVQPEKILPAVNIL